MGGKRQRLIARGESADERGRVSLMRSMGRQRVSWEGRAGQRRGEGGELGDGIVIGWLGWERPDGWGR